MPVSATLAPCARHPFRPSSNLVPSAPPWPGASVCRRSGSAGGDLVHPTRGVHARSAPGTLAERAAAFAMGMPPGRAFSHLTAALLWGLPLPSALEASASAEDASLHVIAPTADGMARRVGVVGHRGLEVRSVASPAGTGLMVVDVADTWCDLGELPRGSLTLTDLVVAADAAVALLDARAGRPGERLPSGTPCVAGTGHAARSRSGTR